MEVPVKCEGFVYLKPFHQGETGAIGEAEILVLIFRKYLPGAIFVPFFYPCDADQRAGSKLISVDRGLPVPEPSKTKFEVNRGALVLSIKALALLWSGSALSARSYQALVSTNILSRFRLPPPGRIQFVMLSGRRRAVASADADKVEYRVASAPL